MAVGEVLFTTAVVTAYDYLLDQPDLLGVDVINNSWGNSFRQFDPRDPVAVATKAVADLGVVVVFAAGNSGYGNAEMSLNPFSQAPWVFSVAAGDLRYRRGDFSSNGLSSTTPQAVQPGARRAYGLHGDRIGIYHPDFTAPGDEHLLDLHAGRRGDSGLPAEWQCDGRSARAWPRRTSRARRRCSCRRTRT